MKDTVTYVRNLLDDNLRLLRVIRLGLKEKDELIVTIEETSACMENMYGWWKKNPPTSKEL